jgi:hypothetical protein
MDRGTKNIPEPGSGIFLSVSSENDDQEEAGTAILRRSYLSM